MKTTYLFFLIIFSSLSFAQTKQIANEIASLSKKKISTHRDDFGEPNSDKIIDTVQILNDSTYFETYHWTYPDFHSGTDFGTDTLVLRSINVTKSFYLYSTHFIKNFDNRYSSLQKAVIIYPKKSQAKIKKASKINYLRTAKEFNFVKKGSSTYLITIIFGIGLYIIVFAKKLN